MTDEQQFDHDPVTCMCDECIRERVRARVIKRVLDEQAEAYIKRRGGLDRPPNRKQP